jgi:hypothetical protein
VLTAVSHKTWMLPMMSMLCSVSVGVSN